MLSASIPYRFPRYLVLSGLLLGAFPAAHAQIARQVVLNVVGSDNGIVGPYRWLVEEDRMYHTQPGAIDPNTLALSFHASYMPVVDKGTTATGPTTLTLPDSTKHYYVSVLPVNAGSYTIGGAPIAPTQSAVTVYVNRLPLPTAQITVFVFEDTKPINNIPDLPEEQGLPGFSVVVEDAGGRYGISGGPQTQDAFGNKLGTIYKLCEKQSIYCDPYKKYELDGPVGTGNPIPTGWQPLVTGPCPGPTCGELTIKHLHPGKYGVVVVPPPGQGWQQTSTIEGTKVIDAWVKPNEPPFFAEFGPPGFHVSFGFVRQFTDATVLTGGFTITGKIVNLHLSRPPDYAFYNGAPIEHTTAWVGLNDNGGAPGASKGVFAKRVNPDGTFSIPNVPPGNYQLAVWDDALDLIFGSHGVVVHPTGSCNTLNSCNLGDVPVFQWFTRTHHHVFSDDGCAGTPQYNPLRAGNGFRESCEKGIPGQNINIRWRDGTVYQAAPTDSTGFVPFDETFPFFAWQVAEVDFTRFKPTGVTVTVDDGGPIPFGSPWSFDDQLNPQPQFCTPADVANPEDVACFGKAPGTPASNPYSGNSLARTYQGPVLLRAFQGFLGQLSVFQWGKAPYGPGENGGISGVVYYDTTRAENDPKNNFPEPWSPGIPGVTVNLHVRDPITNALTKVATTTTDSWDASQPAGCQGAPFIFTYPGGQKVTDCYDGLRVFNQVRPGVFDGGYAFTACPVLGGKCVAPGTAGAVEGPLPAGEYIVEVAPLKGPGGKNLYEIVKEEDKNVDFGDNYVPSPNLVPAECVGPLHQVPQQLTLFPGVTAPFALQMRPLCNMRKVLLGDGSNAAADFFLFTEVPIAGHIFGMILDDAANEFDPNSPNFGEKYAPPFLPVSIRDWTGREMARTYADKFGRFNALVPSTYTANRPSPSGVAPNMITTCMNSRTRADGTQDPFWNPQYSEFCYNFQYMPGATTYLDTPVVPVAAFAGPNQQQLDCEFPDGTPRIKQVSVNNGLLGGPLVTAAGQTITIDAVGTIEVPNPAYCPGPPITTADACPIVNTQKTIPRDYGFGDPTKPGSATIGGVPLEIVTWSLTQITATVPAGVATGQLVVTRGENGKATIAGLTVNVGLDGKAVRYVTPSAIACDGSALKPCPIQQAIDQANDDDLILVSPGVYKEMVIMWKPVRLQGYGEGFTTIDAIKLPTEKLQNWRAKVADLVAKNLVTLLPGQEVGLAVGGEPVLLFNEEGAGVLVLAKSSKFKDKPNARIDGFTITGADTGGGIVVNGHANYLEISNNRITNNNGFFGGGVRAGHPELTPPDGLSYSDANNDFVRIHNNHIAQNGGLGGTGGGVSVCTGSDDYQVTDNFICGNFSMRDGGGIGHLGLSTRGLIARNTILFNENFSQGIGVYGGGIFIAGQPLLPGMTLSPGSGSVKLIGNLIQGNLAGAGDGGGVRLSRVNGQDVTSNRNRPDRWYGIDLFNNLIVDNVAGLAGGGISLQDVAKVNILHNTVAHNDSTATAGPAFTLGNPNNSNPQPAGIVAYAHSTALRNALNASGLPATDPLRKPFANPNLQDNIIWRNRSFYFQVVQQPGQDLYKLMPDLTVPGAQPVYNDLAVVGTASATDKLSPLYSVLTSTTGYDPTNKSVLPSFVAEYFNGHAGVTIIQPETTTAITAPPAFDEGGNFIRVRFGPLTLMRWDPVQLKLAPWGDYHITAASQAVNAGINLTALFPDLLKDYDGEPRPVGTCNANGTGCADIGADELPPAPAAVKK